MKKSRKLAFVLTLALVFSCFGSITSFALDNGYRGAMEYTGRVTDYLSSATETEWYQFTLTADDVATPYSVSLKSSGSCIYSFDFWYRSGTSGLPSVVSNEVTGTRSGDTRTMSGVLTEPGTYFVRVYFLSGTVSTLNTYRLTINHNKTSTIDFFYNSTPETEKGDWAACADLLGNYTYNSIIKDSATNRNYKNAYSFVTSNYTSDAESGYASPIRRNTFDNTVIAANYVYSGSLMTKPKFKLETNKIYSIEELMYYLYELDQPIIFCMSSAEFPNSSTFRRYVMLEGVNIGSGFIRYYDPASGGSTYLEYSEFLTDGFPCEDDGTSIKFTGTSIVNTNLPRPVQPIYN